MYINIELLCMYLCIFVFICISFVYFSTHVSLYSVPICGVALT